MGDTLRNRGFVTKLPIPVILGLEEQIDGALLEFVNNLGHVTAGFEAGRHDLPHSVAHHEALLWLALIAAGCLNERDFPEAEMHRERLKKATAGIPRIVEMRHRHHIRPEDEFRMNPGFRNFDPIHKGDVLGTDCRGPVRARETGLVLLPLYQGQGEDGFFLGREVSVWWLRLSMLLRRLGVPALPRLLPGVSRHPRYQETLVVNTWVARFMPLELFHLLGYRKRRWRGRYLVVTRRRETFPTEA
jgi:succinylglutamate desuccinylase